MRTKKSLPTLLQPNLKRGVFEIETAYDGEEGWKKVQEIKPDLGFLDLLLSKKDGVETLQDMRSNVETKDIPVMILSQLSDNEKISEGVSMGVVGYLVKVDHTLGEVAEKVKAVLK